VSVNRSLGHARDVQTAGSAPWWDVVSPGRHDGCVRSGLRYCVNAKRCKTVIWLQNVAWLVWRSGNGVCHINEVKLHRAQLVLGLVTTFGGSTISVFIQATQSGHPSVGRCDECRRWFRPSAGRNGASQVTTYGAL